MPASLLRLIITVLLATVGLLGLGPVRSATASPPVELPVPGGYQLVASEALGPGVEHQILYQHQPAQTVHVARLTQGFAGRLKPVLANDVLTGPSSGVEPTSAMCARVGCVAALNGDYFDPAADPIGGMVAGGELLSTPQKEHLYLRVDAQGRPTVGHEFDWSVVVGTADGLALPITAVNRSLFDEGIALYSSRWGPSTPTDPTVVEVALRLPTWAGPLPTGVSAVVVGPAVAGGGRPIPKGHVVLSGRGAGGRALVELSSRAGGYGALVVSAANMVSAVGGSPKLLQDGNLAYPTTHQDSLTQDRHPRTVVGVTATEEVLLVTADGRGASAGLTLLEAAELLRGLGAVHALALDGGGSTTFIAGGAIRNTPSGGSERWVASGLAIVPPSADPLAALMRQVSAPVRVVLDHSP